MATKLSFVIPAYNEEDYVGKCIESILRETKSRNDIEIIVVDNNSNDHTGEVAKKYPGVIVVRETRRGANAARKRGFEESHGELVAFPDADTIMLPGWVAYAEAQFAQDKNLACVSGPFIYYDLPIRIRILVRTFYILSYAIYLFGKTFFRTATTIQGGNYMVRRTALQAIGDEYASISFYGDDTYLALRLSKVGAVKFSFKMPILTSGRRLAKEGPWMMGLRYALNNFWIILFHRPWTMSSREIRFAGGETVYQPEKRWREVLIAGLFAIAALVVLVAIVFLVYGAIRMALSS